MAEENFMKDPIGYIGGWLDPFMGGPERSERKARQEKERLEFERKLRQAREGRETTVDEKNYFVEGNVWIDYNGDDMIDYNEVIDKSRFFSDEGATFFLSLEPYMANRNLAFEIYDSNGKRGFSAGAVVNSNEANMEKLRWYRINFSGLEIKENNFTVRYVLSDGNQSTVLKNFPLKIIKFGGEDEVAKIQQLQN